MKQHYLLLLLSTLLLSACGYTPPPLPPEGTYIPPELITTVSMQDSYPQGGVGTIDITVSMKDPDNVIPEAVFFLNVVEVDEVLTYPQATQALFSFAEISEPIFGVVHKEEELDKTFSTTLKFKLKNNAPVGDYLIAIQLFRGRNTDPNATNFNYRLGLNTYNFLITPNQANTH